MGWCGAGCSEEMKGGKKEGGEKWLRSDRYSRRNVRRWVIMCSYSDLKWFVEENCVEEAGRVITNHSE